jgi:DNA-binding GntR family transcriptional regulator
MLHVGKGIPIKRSFLKTQVYDYLKEQIINNRLDINEIYSEQYFSNILNISRTPIREAILQLSHEKLIEIQPNRGFLIRLITEEELKEIYEIRKVIEGYCCAQLARNHILPEAKNVLKNLGNYINHMQEDISCEKGSLSFMDDDSDFHMDIVKYSQNNHMINIMLDLRAQIKSIGVETFKIEGRKETTINEHNMIFLALTAGDSTKAREALENHLINGEYCLKNSLLVKKLS